MTCSEADANCPIVRGALDRVSLPTWIPRRPMTHRRRPRATMNAACSDATELWYVMQQAAL